MPPSLPLIDIETASSFAISSNTVENAVCTCFFLAGILQKKIRENLLGLQQANTVLLKCRLLSGIVFLGDIYE